MVIYVDVLLVLNLYINYFLIRGTAIITRFELSVKRCLISSGVGALFSMVILFPELPFWITALVKLSSGWVIVFLAFGRKKNPDMIITVLVFLIISFLYAGLMLGLWLFVAPFGMFYRNGTAYFDIPIIAIAIFTALAYFVIRALSYISDKRGNSIKYADIEIKLNGEQVKLRGLSDTGNSLIDPFSGRNVIICPTEPISSIIPDNIKAYLSENAGGQIDKIMLIPCHTIAGETLIPIFSAESIRIDNKPVRAVIGVCRKEFDGADCIFNPNLIL